MNDYDSKLLSAREAVAMIQPGRRILIGSGAAEPETLVEALVTDGDHLIDNDIVHLLTLGAAPYAAPDLAKRFRHTAFFIGKNVREAVHAGRADFMPVFLSEIPELLRSRRVPVDVAMIQVSPPDRHGYVSLGVAVDIVRAGIEAADLVLAEMNPRMPRTLGDSFLHVSEIDALVKVDRPLLELKSDPLDATCEAIGRNVASLVPNGATLQTGIGKIPDAVLAALSDKQDLGVHTEMFSDRVMDLVSSGVINGTAKSFLPRKIVTSFVMGSRKLYDWVHDNPSVEFRPSDFTNDPYIIAQNDRMIAVNSALAVDLTGQVASDTLMGRFFSGIGGQVDFIRGAVRSRGGKPIIALPATAKNGTMSRIQAVFEEGAGVVTSRGDVHYVVTEFGVAHLWGRSVRERTLALIEVAHPDFRGELLDHAKQRRYVFPDQTVPQLRPWAEPVECKLANGRRCTLRPARASDAEPLQDFFYHLSEDSRRHRFLGKRIHFTREELHRLVDLDDEANMALVALPTNDASGALVAVATYVVDPATAFAEVAFAVHDDWQNQLLATNMMKRLIKIARRRGLRGFTATILRDNQRMLSVFQQSGLKLTIAELGDQLLLRMRFKG